MKNSENKNYDSGGLFSSFSKNLNHFWTNNSKTILKVIKINFFLGIIAYLIAAAYFDFSCQESSQENQEKNCHYVKNGIKHPSLPLLIVFVLCLIFSFWTFIKKSKFGRKIYQNFRIFMINHPTFD